MVCGALRPYGHARITPHFLSNIDGAHLHAITNKVNPETTLFIVASKTFTTQETITNALSARDWLLKHVPVEKQAVRD
jgi:glucose-6-phosphate isomerase